MTRLLTKVVMERALEIEMEKHLQREIERPTKERNARNGHTLKTDATEIPLEIPRDGNA